ncbi:MAG: response regulator, partial [Gammaproteobacteria bacterium]
DRQSGKVLVMPERQMQDKSKHDYYLRGMHLNKGETYASALSPNVEHGKIEMPLVPVVRFVTPVIGDNDVRYGMLVINILAENYFRIAQEANGVNPNRRFYLISDHGEYFFHTDKKKSFASTLGHNANFEADFPGLLADIVKYDENRTLAAYGKIIAFRHIHPNGNSENGFLLVGIADELVAMAELHSFVSNFFLLVLAVSFIVLIVARYFISGLMGPLESVTRHLQRLGRGETGGELIEYAIDDEIGQMVESQRILMTNMERLAAQADVISHGDFSGTVPLLSEQDQLGKAINNMTLMLRNSREQELHSNWLKDGINSLNQALIGELSPQQLADTAISLTGRTLEAGRGVFYRYDKEQQNLILLGSYMFTEHEKPGKRFQLGEGAVGQVALERKPIILHAAVDALPIVTGTRRLSPQHIYTYPLLRETELLGVIEFASFHAYPDFKLTFLSNAAEVMASFLYITEQSVRIKDLLRVSKEATRQAREQNIQLQNANSKMEEQQQQLQQQTEELQSSNAQMEEQQQQLQQQSEELQQTNAQLEEQQRQMEQQALELENKNRDLSLSRDHLNQRAQELELASQYKSEFLANMSHELRTPLNAIILLSKMLAMNEEKHLSEEEAKRAAIVHHSGEELLRLINDILDLSKIESGKMELNLTSISTRELEADFHDLFSAMALEKMLEFKIEDRMQSDFVSDREKLSQVVRNLLSNAFKFTRQGRVTLRFEASGRNDLPLCISVTDTGIGIAADKQQLVFEAFQQLDGSISREYGGTGLGLSISQRFTELLGGTIELKSTPGKGSTFSLLLPMLINLRAGQSENALPSAVEKINAPEVLSAKPVFQVHDDRANLKSSDQVILVIDDDPGFLEALMVINKQLGYKTLIAVSGQEGLRMAKTYRPRGILLDLGLPDMDGHAVLHSLKNDRELRGLPVHIVSARDQLGKALHEGIVGYLQKPVSQSQLADAEARVLANSAEQSNTLLLLEGLSLSRVKLEQMVRPDGLKVVAVSDLPAAIAALNGGSWRLAVVDLVREEGVENAAEICHALREAAPELHLILHSNKALSADNEAALRRYTDSIIVNAPHAEQRILENIERFLQNMPTGAAGTSALTNTTTPEQDSKKLSGRRILVVDDDSRNLFVITSALEQHGALVDNALNAQKGLEKLALNGADLVFMDIMMPGMDGYEAIRKIRADASLRQIPIVALTAKALKADRENALNSGADDYLSKPVDYEVLVNMADIWCREKR